MTRPRASARPRALYGVLAVGVFQATAYGMYETAHPLFLQSLGISFLGMGLIFGLSQVGMLGVRYAVGDESDRRGRKPFFVAALAVAAGATALTPAWTGALAQGLLKLARDAAGVVRDVMRSLVVYEHAGTRFVRWIGRFVGTEFFFMAVGAVFAGWAAERLGWAPLFLTAGALSALACAGLWIVFGERAAAARPERSLKARTDGQSKVGFLDLPPGLLRLTVSDFVFNVGLMTSHSFYLLLFFKEKFGYSIAALGVIQMLHRFSLGVPMIAAGQLMDRPRVRRRYRALYVGSMAAQGTCLALAGALPSAPLAVGVFLLHDVVGATIFSPIHAAYVQAFARPERRGRDVALSSGLASLGYTLGPLLAGWLVGRWGWRDGPYVASGTIIVLASLLVLRIRPPRLATPGANG